MPKIAGTTNKKFHVKGPPRKLSSERNAPKDEPKQTEMCTKHERAAF